MSRHRGVLRAATLGCVVSVLPLHALAQSAVYPVQGTLASPAIALDPGAIPHVESTRLPGPWEWSVGALVELLERPVTARELPTSSPTAVSSHQLWTRVVAQLGLGERFAIGLELPAMLSQGGHLQCGAIATSPEQCSMPRDANGAAISSLGTTSFGDVRLLARWSTRRQPSLRKSDPDPAGTTRASGGWGVGVNLSVSAPTGIATSFAGLGAWSVHPSVVVDYRLGPLLVAAQLGYRARLDGYWLTQGSRCATASDVGDVACVGNVPLRDAITWSAGVRLDQEQLARTVGLYGEVLGAFDARSPATPNTTVVEAGLGVQRRQGEFTLQGGVSSGLTDVPGNPRVRVMVSLQWAPRFVDQDGDGLREDTGQDKCVDLAEDRDGFEDEDGCPEDNDHDAIADDQDKCPNVDEDVDHFEDEDGCPDLDNDGDGVNDDRDQCRDTAMGENPDEVRPGCPNLDVDGDGVENPLDICPFVAVGPTPDAAPSRRGCPAPDSDDDGVADPVDACPSVAAGQGAESSQRGCPDPDMDHDGVVNDADRCPDLPESLDGVNDDDGCPDTVNGAPAITRPAQRVDVIARRIRFTATHTLDAQSMSVVDAVARGVMAGAPRNSENQFTLTVAMAPANTPVTPTRIDVEVARRRRDEVVRALQTRGVPWWSLRAVEPVVAALPVMPGQIVLVRTRRE